MWNLTQLSFCRHAQPLQIQSDFYSNRQGQRFNKNVNHGSNLSLDFYFIILQESFLGQVFLKHEY